MDLTNLPWVVKDCGNPKHGPEWTCHRVEDSTGKRLLQSVSRDVAERFASIPALVNEAATARAEGYAQAREQAAAMFDADAEANRGTMAERMAQRSAERIRAMTPEGDACAACGHVFHDDNACGACAPGACVRSDS